MLRTLGLFFPAPRLADFVVHPLNLPIFLSVRLAFLKLRQLFSRGQSAPRTHGSRQLWRVFVASDRQAKMWVPQRWDVLSDISKGILVLHTGWA